MEDQKRIPLYQALIKHTKNKPISFHVPGHKNGQIFQHEANEFYQPFLEMDVTELSGLDDLHSPEGVIREGEQLLASLYNVKQSFFLVNGSTVGNLAMIMASCRENDTVLVQRNCHKSVVNAIKLAKARPIFLEPEFNPIWKVAANVSLDTVKKAICLYPEAKALILTYPNYYGMVYDIKGLISHAHLHDIPVLVDEAHGAHFIIDDPFPSSAVSLGADAVVQSAHKTLPAMTMGSYLHINSDRINLGKLKDYLQILQSSSPSYPIMASLDLARQYLAMYEGKDINYLIEEVNYFRQELKQIPSINVLEYPNSQGDQLKVTIQSRNELSGFELQKRFEQKGIYTELADTNNVLFIMPLLKEKQSYPHRLALEKIKSVLANLPLHFSTEEVPISREKIKGLAIPYELMFSLEVSDVPITDAVDTVCAETIIPYPPGVPLLLKGELITDIAVKQLNALMKSGARFQGGSSLDRELIKVFWTR
ncbi:aminotransferase class I/II-fold pyridoxal phosphate-dependent enzyme [Neobacillus sp. FSL H8-0543]|uniref:aminotransferase class I/II-fold pyridoxal phosphate-dependent enzyme n=1 Tax=Neobacillus sp. FSL H8-0543 TaxID=2954672 RepID=UPI003158EAC0